MPTVDRAFDAGDVVRFVFLHLGSAELLGPHDTKQWHSLYRVEGKARPMIVITRNGHPNKPEKCIYNVLPLTTKGRDERGEKKPRHEPVGRLAGDREDSFAILELHQYPAQLIAPGSKATKVSRETRDNLIRLLAYKGIRGPTFDSLHGE